MKRMNRILLAATFLFGLALTGCDNPINPHHKEIDENDLKVESVSFDITEKTCDIDDKFTITPTVKFVDDVEVEVDYVWTSSAPTVASVNNGEVKALKEGKSYISLLVGLKTAICTVTVNGAEDPGPGPGPGPQPPLPGEFSFELNITGRSLHVNETLQLETVMNEPSEVTWRSENPEVATVDENGLVTALKENDSTYIVASTTFAEKDYEAKCLISVIPEEEEDPDMDFDVYFFIDYNNLDEEDTTGTKLLAHFKWYSDRPLTESMKVPTNPSTSMDPAFPYFIGWSTHGIIDSKDKLWDMSGKLEDDPDIYPPYVYFFGIWADVPAGSFVL